MNNENNLDNKPVQNADASTFAEVPSNVSNSSMNNDKIDYNPMEGFNRIPTAEQMNSNMVVNEQQTIVKNNISSSNITNQNVNQNFTQSSELVKMEKLEKIVSKRKVRNSSKNFLVIGVLLLISIMIVISFVGSKSIVCTNTTKLDSSNVSMSVKVSYWFDKINKITSVLEYDLTQLSDSNRELLVKKYENINDGSLVENNGKTLKITKINKPTVEDKNKGGHLISPDKIIESYEDVGFVCKS